MLLAIEGKKKKKVLKKSYICSTRVQQITNALHDKKSEAE